MSFIGRRAREGGGALLVVLSVAAAVFFFNLGDAQLWDRDEPRNAGCAMEMMQRGDWVVPIFNGELRFQKPVLLYWMIMIAYQGWGVCEFAARFWSAATAVGTVAVTFFIARKLFNPTIALYSGIILSSNLMFVVAARAATPDSLLIFFSTLGIACFVWGADSGCCGGDDGVGGERSAGKHPGQVRLARSFDQLNWRWLVLMGLSMAMAMLAKGPVGFVMPMAIMGMFLLIVRAGDQHLVRSINDVIEPQQNQPLASKPSTRWGAGLKKFIAVVHPIHFIQTTFAMRPMVLLGIVLLIAAPWYAWVGFRTEGDFLRQFFLSEHLGRATTTFENHSGGFWFYPVAILIGFFPWSLFWLPVAMVAWANRRDFGDAACLMMCWIGVQVGIFSIAQTKLPSYITPCYPALAILTAASLHYWVNHKATLSGRWMVAALITGIGVGVAITSIAVLAVIYYLPGRWSLPAIGLVLVVAASAALVSWKNNNHSDALDCFTTGAVVFVLMLFGIGASDVASIQTNRTLLDPISQLPNTVGVASFECLESSWPFYSRRTISETNGDAAAKSIARLKDWKPKPVTSPESFAEQNRDCVFITTDQRAEELISRLPDRYQVLGTTEYLFRRERLVLVGPADRFPALSLDP